MVYLREWITRGFKTRFFLKTANSGLVHISSLYGSVVKAVTFGKGFIEYSVEIRDPLVLYEVVFVEGSLKTVVRELPGFKILGELEGIPHGLSSVFRVVDKVVSEACSYRRYWSTILCGTPGQACDYYMVDLLARGSIAFSLCRRVKELHLELSREYVGFVTGLLVYGLLSTGFKLLKSEGEHCVLAGHAEPVSWRDVKLWLGSGEAQVLIEVEKRLGAANPDLTVHLGRGAFLFECKTGPPKTWLSKAIKQAMLYREVGKPVLVASRPLGRCELEYLNRYYHAVLTCTPDNTPDCRNRLLEVLEN